MKKKLRVVEGGRQARERELLSELLKPGLENLEKIETLSARLRSRGALQAASRHSFQDDEAGRDETDWSSP